MENKYMQQAKELLAQKEENTCAIVWKADAGKEPYVSEYKGIRPIMEFLKKGESLKGAYIADKVIGKAAAFLMVYGGAVSVYARVISGAAKDVFSKAGVCCEFEKEVPYIINRKDDGICPVEVLCKDCVTAAQCLPLIREFVTKISTSKRII